MLPAARSPWRAPLTQEPGEGLRRHLARSHGELAMAGLAQTADVAVNRHVIGRVGKDQIRPLISQKGADRLSASRVPADEPMTPEEPHIAETGHCGVLVGEGR